MIVMLNSLSISPTKTTETMKNAVILRNNIYYVMTPPPEGSNVVS